MNASTARLLRGFLEPCLLSLLAEQADYGLSLVQRLAAAGLDEVPGGTLYPALMRMEKRGLVAVSWRPSTSGPARKYYELTDAGRAELAARREEWRTLRTAFSAVLEGAPPRTHTGDQTRAADGAHA